MPGLPNKDKRENSQGVIRPATSPTGLVIATNGLPDMASLEQQVEALSNLVSAQSDVTQALNPLRTVYAEYNTATAQTFASGGIGTYLNADTRVYDTHNAVTTGTTWGFRFPLTGPYHVDVSLLFDASTAWATGETAYIRAVINGVVLTNLAFWAGPDTAGGSVYVPLIGSRKIWGKAGDVFRALVWQNSGSDRTLVAAAVYNYIAIQFMG